MTSERYLWRESDRVSWRKVLVPEAVSAVRKRLMKAVFFLSEVSREDEIAKTSVEFQLWLEARSGTAAQVTSLASPHSRVQI